jgi:hypothetical protein
MSNILKNLCKGGRIRTGVRKIKLKRGIYMNDIMSSAAFQEFLQKRCEEITEKDERYKMSNDKIISLEGMLKKSLTPQQLKEYNEIEQEIMDSSEKHETLLYKRGFIDGIAILSIK